MSAGLHYLELVELAELLSKRAVTSVEVTRAQLERVAYVDRQLHSYAIVNPEEALAGAAAADAEIASGRYRGPLHGVPIAVKDLFWTKGMTTSGGMPIYRDFSPPEDATAVARLRAAGAIVLGKLQMTEGAYSDHHPSIPPPVNPWNSAYWTGISSSGCAAAIAAGLSYGSPASDTGGSIRWPCSATGLTGIKPTWGRVSRFGTFALAPSLDHVGTMGRSAADAAVLLGAIAGPDLRDPTSLSAAAPDLLSKDSIRGLRIGADPRWNANDLDEPVRAVMAEARAVFKELGAMVVETTLPDLSQAVVDWSTICAVEAAIAHEGTFPARREEYGPVLASVLDAGRAACAIELQKATERRKALRAQFGRLFDDVDVVLAPVQPFEPLRLETIQSLGKQPKLILKLQRFTAPFDMTGDPTITLPGGFSPEGMPVGFQLIAGHLGEGQLVRAARAFQEVTIWHRRHAGCDASEVLRNSEHVESLSAGQALARTPKPSACRGGGSRRTG